jgi:hypothetical protein
MKLLIPYKDFDNKKSRDLIPLECKNCGKSFNKLKCSIQMGIKKTSRHSCDFCSKVCFGEYKTKTGATVIKCEQCKKEFTKHNNDIKRNNHHFCSSSCSATYHNTHKEYGTRRSKLEKWIEDQLTILYPTLEIHYNRTDTINAELDIYIPSLKLAFEFNGIFHYEPIYGDDKLKRTKNNDDRKFQLCSKNNIGLCVIDTHNVKYLKKERDGKFLDIIKSIVDIAIKNIAT